MTTVSDDFNRADNTNIGSNWSPASTVVQIVSNQLKYRNNGAAGGPGWNANTFSGNQFAQCTIVQIPSNEYSVGPVVRASSAADVNGGYGYNACVRSDGAVRLTRNTSIVYTSSAGAFANGDVLRLEDRGSGSIVIMKNGVDYYTGYTDATPLTGTYIGLAAYAVFNGATPFIVDDFSGGDLAGGASVVPLNTLRSNQFIAFGSAVR